jgi:cold shock CspA family protein
MQTTGTVKFFNGHHGFVTPDDGALDCYVNASTLGRCGLVTLERGAKVRFSSRPDRFDAGRGQFVTEIALLDDGPSQ